VLLADVRGDEGEFRWLLREPQPFATPVPMKGRQKLWLWEAAF
jgi:hypothetical protein